MQTEDGLKPIEQIEVGDRVLSYDEQTGEQAYKKVVQLFRTETDEWYHIRANGEEIVCTGGHPFYVADEGFVCAKDLKVGNLLLLSNGNRVKIEAIQVEKLLKPEIKYNFEVEDFHTYYVTESEILVHNMCKVTEKAEIHGKPHGSPEHQARIMQEVESMQKSGKYTDIYMNKSLKTANLNGSQRPDIIGKMLDGTFDAVEVASKTQVSSTTIGKQLASKVALMQANNPDVVFKIIWLFG